MKTLQMTVRGLVQGIGFRPFVYNLAHRFGIKGYVLNRSGAVEIVVQGKKDELNGFRRSLTDNPPALARIESITECQVELRNFESFAIAQSVPDPDDVTDVSPDMAVCEHCLSDIGEQRRRKGYPLVNCTLCGPRFSIIKSLPYDRPNTTMKPFVMCSGCAEEYGDPGDRRFHAQPIACNDCGPEYVLEQFTDVRIHGNAAVIDRTASLLEQGAIVAIKGTGGFHLACNPFVPSALDRLRSGKRRDGKPFALMFRDVESLRTYALVGTAEEALMRSAECPIVLVKSNGNIPQGVNGGLATVGAMLPSMPFHHLLFQKLSIPALVMTSGNISDEPVLTEETEAGRVFACFADAVASYNRIIQNRVDDSVCAVYDGQARIFRRSRGFVPLPINLPWSVDGIAASGAELKCCFALGKKNKALLSQHIGDLKSDEAFRFYRESYDRFCSLFRVRPELFAHDAHPDYLSTRFAADTGLALTAVQHHHAHIASCCAENGIERKVIGVVLDGTGFGDDGAVWGGEFMTADLERFDRYAHLRYVGMPGGERAVLQPWRMAAAYLRDAFEGDSGVLCRSLLNGVQEELLDAVETCLMKRINLPFTSSMGRFFDAVAAMGGLCQNVTFEAEAAMRLESRCADPLAVEPYSWKRYDECIDFRPAVRQIAGQLRHGVDIGTVSTRFHATIIESIVGTCECIRGDTGIGAVVLSGGCFQNRCIFECSAQRLRERGFLVITHRQVPCNDGGVALGQLTVAARRRR